MKDSALKVLLRTIWVIFIVLTCLKLIGCNWFEINVENTQFIAICAFIDKHLWLKIMVACVFNLISSFIYLCILFNEKRLSLKQAMVFTPLVIGKSLIGWYNSTIAFCLDLIILIVIPLFFKVKIKRLIVCFLLLNAFQLMSLLIRNIGFRDFNNNTTLFSIVMQLDYYLMLVITYLYNLKLMNVRK